LSSLIKLAMDRKNEENQGGGPNVELSDKESLLEILAVGMCFMLLLGCFLKVVFF